jgi:triacylglycerol esterase/lipase EstA (alpha/beta hydrolase family)
VLSSLAPARRRLLLVVLALLVAAAAVTSALVVVARSDPPSHRTAPVAQDRPGPVLLVPGYGGSVTGLTALAGRLRAAGKDTEVVSLPGNAQGDLGQQARALATAARAALSRTGASSVDVVGYSAGGVVARLWAKDYGGAAVIRRIITLGSPQHGTVLATLGSLVNGACPLACQQLVPASTLLAALNTAPELPPGPVFVSLWSSRDQVVLPPDSARLTGAVNIEIQQVCARSVVSHAQLPTDPLVAALVVAELSAGPVRQFGAADCAGLSAAG